MKTLMITLAAASLAAAAQPAAAHPQMMDRRAFLEGANRADSLLIRIDRAERQGELRRRTADRLRADVRAIHRQERLMRADGLDHWELRRVAWRYDQVDERLDAALSLSRTYGYGYGPDYGWRH